MLSRKSFVVAAFSASAFLVGSSPLSAATLSAYYKTLMTVKTCELTVSEEAMGALQTAIENKVTDIGASSDTINSIFTSLNTAIGEDVAGYCAAESSAALEVIGTL